MNCSPEIFRFVCAYHQVEPFFLETVFPFGKQPYPFEYCLAHFRSKTFVKSKAVNSPSLPQFGGSGDAIHVSYLLRSVEHLEAKGIEGWHISQAANYHTFDLESGRAFWFTIKDNKMFEDRIKDLAPRLKIPSRQETADGNIASYLKVSLNTHLLYLSWCDEGWREFINDFETSIRNILLPTKAVRVQPDIDAQLSHYHTFPRTLQQMRQQETTSNNLTRRNNGLASFGRENEASATAKTRFSSFCHSIFGLKTTKPDEEQSLQFESMGDFPQSLYSTFDFPETLGKLRLKDLQTLHSRSELIQRSILVLELNTGVLRGIHVYYSNLTKTRLNNPKYREIVDGFLTRIESTIANLETRRTQLSSLSTHLTQGMHLVSAHKKTINGPWYANTGEISMKRFCNGDLIIHNLSWQSILSNPSILPTRHPSRRLLCMSSLS